MLKAVVKSLLRRHGLQLKPIGAPVRGPENYVRHRKDKGFAFSDILDIQHFDGDGGIAYLDIAFSKTSQALCAKSGDAASISLAGDAAA